MVKSRNVSQKNHVFHFHIFCPFSVGIPVFQFPSKISRQEFPIPVFPQKYTLGFPDPQFPIKKHTGKPRNKMREYAQWLFSCRLAYSVTWYSTIPNFQEMFDVSQNSSNFFGETGIFIFQIPTWKYSRKNEQNKRTEPERSFSLNETRTGTKHREPFPIYDQKITFHF